MAGWSLNPFRSMTFRSVLQVLKKVQPNEIYNLAGQTSVGLSFDQPVESFESISIGTLNLLEAIRFMDIPIRIYNAGSSECFGNTEGAAATEETPFRPRSPMPSQKRPLSGIWPITGKPTGFSPAPGYCLITSHPCGRTVCDPQNRQWSLPYRQGKR